MQPRTYTLKEAVYALNRTGTAEEASRLTRHIRHWTSLDLLKTEGAKYTGTGRSREYSADTIYRAAVLVELARYRVPMPVLAGIFPDIDLEFEDLWAMAVADEAQVFLKFTIMNHGTACAFSVDDPAIGLLDDEIMVPKGPMTGEIEVPASSIVINLSRLLRWVRL